MSSKEILIKELDKLEPGEIIRVRNYLKELRSYRKKRGLKKEKIDMIAVRKSLSNIKGSMSDMISDERADRL